MAQENKSLACEGVYPEVFLLPFFRFAAAEESSRDFPATGNG